MLFRYMHKNIKRNLLTNGLFCLLLVLAGALLSLAAGLWYSVYVSERDMENSITTIGLVNADGIRRYARANVRRNYISEYETEWGLIKPNAFENWRLKEESEFEALVATLVERDLMRSIEESVYSSGSLKTDDRRVYGAAASGVIAPTQSAAAFIVRCAGVEVGYRVGGALPYISSSDAAPYFERMAYVKFDVERALSPHHSYEPPDTLSTVFPFSNADGGASFKAGARYLVIGYFLGNSRPGDYENYFMKKYGWIELDAPNSISAYARNQFVMDAFPINYYHAEVGEVAAPDDFNPEILRYLIRTGYVELYDVSADDFPLKVVVRVPEAGQTPSWFELEGSLEDALSSQDGKQIKQALDAAEISSASLMALTTDDINSLFQFNQRRARITAGRGFTASETKTGANVCIVSAELAELNGLSAGDTLWLRLYPTSLNQIRSYGGGIVRTNIFDTQAGADSVVLHASCYFASEYWPQEPYYPGLPLSEPSEYVITGIYSAPRGYNDYLLPPGAVIIPAKSFGGFDGYDYIPPARSYTLYNNEIKHFNLYAPPLLHTVIIPNGKIEETQALIENLVPEGLGRHFRYYDQGYSVLKPAFINIRAGTTFIFMLAAAGWAVAAGMFCMLYIGRRRREAAVLYALGVSGKKRFRWVYMQCAALIGTAMIITICMTLPLFGGLVDAATRMAQSDTQRDVTFSDAGDAKPEGLEIDKNPLAVALPAAGQTALLLAAAWMLSRRAVVFGAFDTKGGGG